MKPFYLFILISLLLISCNRPKKDTTKRLIVTSEKSIKNDDFSINKYLENPGAKISLPYYFSNKENTTTGTPLAGEINTIISQTGIGQTISLDIRNSKDSVVFNQQIVPVAFGLCILGNYYLVFAQNEAGESSDTYLFVMDRTGKITDHLKVKRTLGYFHDNKPLDLLQSAIDKNGTITTSEIVYPGDIYIDIFKKHSLQFNAYRLDKKYKINHQGMYNLIDSTSYPIREFTLKKISGVNIKDL